LHCATQLLNNTGKLAQLAHAWICTLECMKMELPEIPLEERTPLVERLREIVLQLLDRVGELEESNQRLRDEVAVLKGQKPRPDIKPSLLESSKAQPKQPTGSKRPGSAKRPKLLELHIDHEVTLHPENLPEGAIFKGYESYVVQELIIKSENIKYLRARYELPEGGSVLAPFPPGVLPVEGGHFAASVVAYALDQYHQAGVTEPLLLQQLWEFGIDISSGQLHRILTENKERFHEEKIDMLQAGLLESSYIGTDDTGARHQGQNGYCTVIGNELFAYFESSDCKSRLNFLRVLHGGQPHYAINETTLAYWQRQELAAALVAKLTQGPQEFADETVWQARLAELEIIGERHVRIATEGALLGGLVARGVSPGLGVMVDCQLVRHHQEFEQRFQRHHRAARRESGHIS